MHRTVQDLDHLRQAGQIVGSVLYDLQALVRPGLRPTELNEVAERLIRERGGQPAFLGYQHFPATICVSVNDAVVHGIPNKIPLKEGDLVGIDAGAIVNGWYADAAITVGVGSISPAAQHLLEVTEEALQEGIARVGPNRPLGDVQAAIQRVIEAAKLGIIRDLIGHGIGRELHEEPPIPNYGRAGSGPILKPGMTICLEPMVTLGSPAVHVGRDGWTISTKDGSLGAQFEHTILVTGSGYEILTQRRPWPVPSRRASKTD